VFHHVYSIFVLTVCNASILDLHLLLIDTRGGIAKFRYPYRPYSSTLSLHSTFDMTTHIYHLFSPPGRGANYRKLPILALRRIIRSFHRSGPACLIDAKRIEETVPPVPIPGGLFDEYLTIITRSFAVGVGHKEHFQGEIHPLLAIGAIMLTFLEALFPEFDSFDDFLPDEMKSDGKPSPALIVANTDR
jgi:hypothetical protein